MNFDINLWSVLAAGIASYAVGALWYSPLLFGNVWLRLRGMSKEQMQAGMTPKVFFLGFVSSLVMAYVLAHILIAFEATTLSLGLVGSFWAWLGFVATVLLGSYLYEKSSFKLYLLNAAHYLVGLLVMGAILAVWR